ncbi:MAG: Holliday junction branch migration protein RuvA [Lachnospiraceae bacterium]|nr:Holliday junction branch migration protein RuvA [Lachnospiraceae bacterium]
MIGYIKGRLEEVMDGAIIVDNNGIGYEILVPASVIGSLPSKGNEVKIYTYMNVREDLLQLFGFMTRDDLEVFKMLITVSGIGPKGALGILGVMSADDVRFAVMSEDAKTISKAPGIGAKTARKLIIELKDKLNFKDVIEGALDRGESAAANNSSSSDKQIISDAVEALTALGYSASDAMKAVRMVEMTDDMTVEMLLKLSLKNM